MGSVARGYIHCKFASRNGEGEMGGDGKEGGGMLGLEGRGLTINRRTQHSQIYKKGGRGEAEEEEGKTMFKEEEWRTKERGWKRVEEGEGRGGGGGRGGDRKEGD